MSEVPLYQDVSGGRGSEVPLYAFTDLKLPPPEHCQTTHQTREAVTLSGTYSTLD